MTTISGSSVKRLIVACEAGMGSSVMVAKQLEKQLKKLGVEVSHSPVNQLLSSNPDLVVCHRGLAERAKQAVPDIVVVPFDMFIGDILIAKLVKSIENGSDISDD